MAYGTTDTTKKRKNEVYIGAPSEATKTAQSNVDNLAPFNSQWKDASNNLLQQYVNRDKFSYNPNEDRSFAQYRDIYTRNGQTAMRDTSAQAAALTGGYGSSYATTAAAQTYNKYMQELNDKIPEFEQAAYDRYINEGNELLKRYQASNQQYQQDYSDWLNEYERLYGRYIDERGFDLNDRQIKAGIVTNDESLENSDYWNKTNYDEGVRQFDITSAQNQQQIDENKRQFDITSAQNQQQIDQNQQKINNDYATSQADWWLNKYQIDNANSSANATSNSSAETGAGLSNKDKNGFSYALLGGNGAQWFENNVSDNGGKYSYSELQDAAENLFIELGLTPEMIAYYAELSMTGTSDAYKQSKFAQKFGDTQKYLLAKSHAEIF